MSLEEYLRKEIEKTGYPLEIEISSLLDKKWQHVDNTDTYLDKDEGKLRSIDIYAFDILKSGKPPLLEMETGMVIECKKDENFAWIFFSRPFEFDIEDVAGQYLDETQLATKNTDNIDILEMILGKASLHYQKVNRIAVSSNPIPFYKAKKKSHDKKKDEIFESQNQLSKYIAWSVEQTMKEYTPVTPYYIEMSFPCIVFHGKMYEAIVENGEVTQLKQKDHLILKTLFRFPFSAYEKSLLIDVVTRNHFSTYQSLIRSDVKSLTEIVKKNSKKIFNEIYKVFSVSGLAK